MHCALNQIIEIQILLKLCTFNLKNNCWGLELPLNFFFFYLRHRTQFTMSKYNEK
jgi:hypothetical protein